MWKKDLDISLNRFANSFINRNVHMPNYTWRFTGFYGHPDASKRKYSWDSLRQLSTQSQLPWICIGDYNEVLSQNEFQGYGPRNNWQIMNFRQALMDSNLHDLGYEGFTYTWCHSQTYPNTIRARLDCACATQDFLDIFLESKIKHMHSILADHLPIVFSFENFIKFSKTKNKVKRFKHFMFEAMWIQADNCENIFVNLGKIHLQKMLVLIC